uniref:Uncharacterized protein n=1 Tax=Oryza nivara TaxID=4536 RepID=A0A0E0IA99_ORYNI
MTWTRLLVLPASMTTPYPWGRRRGERDRRRRRRSARADAAARRRRPRPRREPIMEEMEANGSKYQQQKLGDVPSSQPHHLNWKKELLKLLLLAAATELQRPWREGVTLRRPPPRLPSSCAVTAAAAARVRETLTLEEEGRGVGDELTEEKVATGGETVPSPSRPSQAAPDAAPGAALPLAMDLDPDDATLFSNRSLCWLRRGHGGKALLDAHECRKKQPDWSKACYRLGASLMSLKDYGSACDALFDGLKLDPADVQIENALREAFQNLKLSRSTKAK